MKTISNIFRKFALPAVVAGTLLIAPMGASAQSRGGHSGGGRSYSGGARSYSGGGSYGGSRAYSGGAREYRGGSYDRGRYSGGGYYRGGSYGGGYGGGYYRGGVYFGFGAAPYAYGYAPAYAYPPAACGFYDQWGRWQPDPACYAGTLGY